MNGEQQAPRRRWTSVLLSWLAMVGVDLLLHAGILAPLYDWQSDFLLAPAVAFVRIPIGYASFLVLAIALAWLLPRLEVERGLDGALIAGGFGAVVWGALVLGLWSISTAEPALLVGWWVGQSAELAVGGAVIGSVLSGTPVRTVAWRVAALIVACIVTAVILQTIGYAEPPVVIR